jgi:hypothetical protein
MRLSVFPAAWGDGVEVAARAELAGGHGVLEALGLRGEDADGARHLARQPGGQEDHDDDLRQRDHHQGPHAEAAASRDRRDCSLTWSSATAADFATRGRCLVRLPCREQRALGALVQRVVPDVVARGAFPEQRLALTLDGDCPGDAGGIEREAGLLRDRAQRLRGQRLPRAPVAERPVVDGARHPRQGPAATHLRRLAKGLCGARDTSPRTFLPADPARAVPALGARRAEELDRERERAGAAAAELAALLAPLFAAGQQQHDPLQYVEALADPARIAARAIELASAAQRHVNSIVKRPLILSSEQNRRFLQVPLEKGLRYRALYEREALSDPELSGWMAELSRKGQEIRIVPRLPVKLQAFDDEVALLSMQDPVGGPPSFTAVALRHRGAVALLNLAFERLWGEGAPYEDP